jgi:hypothetical protein
MRELFAHAVANLRARDAMRRTGDLGAGISGVSGGGAGIRFSERQSTR